VYCAAALLFIAGCASIATVAVPRQPARKEPATLASLFAGIRFIFQRRILQGTLSLDLFCVLLGGAILMSLVLTRHSLRGAIGLQLFAALFVFGLATVVFGLSKSIPLSIVALAVLGAADSVSMVVRGSLVPLHTPDNMLGRVSAVNTLFIGTSNQLGEFESGVTAALMGTVPAAVLGGIGTIAIAGLWMWWFPELRKLRSLH